MTSAIRSNLISARWYLEHGYSIIPVRRSDKKALIKWREYQTRFPTDGEVKEWWTRWPDANIAIITGKISGIIVVDIDTENGKSNIEEFLPDSWVTPQTHTPSGGWHYFFKYIPGLVNKARVIEGTDIRTDGGYVVVPPSRNGNGKEYSWISGLSISKVPIASFPGMLFDILQQGSATLMNQGIGIGGVSSTIHSSRALSFKNNESSIYYSTKDIARTMPSEDKSSTSNHESSISSKNIILRFEAGSRDQSLFHVANCLFKGGMSEVNIRTCLEILCANCRPPFEKSEIEAKIMSAATRSRIREQGLTGDIREWVESSNGIFLSSNVITELNLSSISSKKQVSNVLRRLCEEGIIEIFGKKRGSYRKVERILDFENIETAEVVDEDIWLPLGLSQKAKLFPGNIVVVAGSPNAGKTAFLLACTRYNFDRYRVRYLSSEMGVDEARLRISEFDDITLGDWQKKWEFAERYDDFEDVLLTGKGNLNIIDYLEQPEGEAWRAADQLKKIHQKLAGAIAIIAIQKNRGVRDTGVGGEQTLAKPRLYIALDYGKAKIVKCKSFKDPTDNPNWQQCRFKLYSGCRFALVGDWVRPGKSEEEVKA